MLLISRGQLVDKTRLMSPMVLTIDVIDPQRTLHVNKIDILFYTSPYCKQESELNNKIFHRQRFFLNTLVQAHTQHIYIYLTPKEKRIRRLDVLSALIEIRPKVLKIIVFMKNLNNS